MDNLAIDKTIEYIKKFFKNDFSGHDYYHSLRVYRNAVKIAKAENADINIVALAALLHDVDDYKLSPDTTASMKNARDFLKSIDACDDEIDAICSIITQISFKGTDTVISDTAEGRCVQDADRLDAIGAIGIARAFAYGGSHNRAIYDPEIPPKANMNGDEYKNSNSTSINHFYEKLFLLEDLMSTETGKEMALKRTERMRSFVADFMSEWNCDL